jgi:hypothetical protein
MKCSVLSWFLVIISTAQAQSAHWESVKVDTHLTVQLPLAAQEIDIPATLSAASVPNQQDAQGQTSRAFRGEDAVATYVMVIVPFSGVTYMPADAAGRMHY